MRRFMIGVSLGSSLGLSALSTSAVAAPAKQWDFPVTIQDKNSELGDLPDALPVEGEEFPAQPPARKSAKSTPGTPAPVPTVQDSVVEDAPPVDSAATMAPEASVEIPGQDTIVLDPQPDAVPETGVVADEALADLPPEDSEVMITPPSEGIRPAVATSRRRGDGLARPYYDHRPVFGFQFVGSPQALGEKYAFANDPDQAEYNVRGFTLSLDLEPKFLQAIGVVSIGPSFTFYPFSITDPLNPAEDATSSPTSVRGFGGAVKYQAYFVKGQVLVPYVGYEWQMVSYKFNAANGSGRSTLSGPVYGAMLQLQWLEHEAAFTAYQNYGLKRSYLVFEMKKLTSAEKVLDTIGTSYWAGVRLEL